MELLVIGGTHFVGRAVVEDAVARGHDVTVFHRGPAEPEGFPEVEHVHGDRDLGLGALAGRTWDVALDTCAYVPRQVRQLAAVLAETVGHYGLVSSISVYPDDTPAGADETTSTQAPPAASIEEVTETSYGPLKVACEREAQAAFAGGCLIVRPGYIVGPHDPSDRFTSWVRRAAAGGRMLVPEPQNLALQIVDVRDLAAFTLDHLEAATDDVFCVVGPGDPLTWGSAMPTLVEVGEADAELAWTGETFLRERLGEDMYEALPLWDVEAPGLHEMDASKATRAGLAYRPFAETVADTLAWDRGRGPLVVGLGAERERDLLEAWDKERS